MPWGDSRSMQTHSFTSGRPAFNAGTSASYALLKKIASQSR